MSRTRYKIGEMLVAGRNGIYFKRKRESRRYKWKTFLTNSNGWFYLKQYNEHRFLTASTNTHTVSESKYLHNKMQDIFSQLFSFGIILAGD